jgi:5-hydroxyisourate hydrolase
MARVSTHVLDTMLGTPAAGVVVELHAVEDRGRRLVAASVTNAEGRTEAPLLTGDRIQPGVYELIFRAADYFRRAGLLLPDPPFLGEVVIRVGIADPAGNYHIPLLLSPYGYVTYRGS